MPSPASFIYFPAKATTTIGFVDVTSTINTPVGLNFTACAAPKLLLLSTMKQSLYKALNIREQEAPLVFRLLLLQFALGLATSFLVTASYSFLLYKYNIQQVPLVYVVVALIMFPVNGLYVRLDLKLSARKLLELVILIATLSIPILVSVWQITKAVWLPMVIVAWNVSLYMLVGYAYWGMASLLFNVRESRRIFSVIGSGDLPAKILGYWAISVFSPVVGIEGTMLFSLIFYGLAFVITRRYFASGKIDWENFESHQHTYTHEHHDKWWMRIFESSLIMRIAMLSMLAYAVTHLSEFTFLSEIKARFDSSSDILKFISTFFAIGRMLALVMKLLLSSRIINGLGLSRSIAFTPIFILLMAAGIISFSMASAHAQLYLYGFGVLFMVSELLRSVIQEPTFFILFQPLNIHLRLKGHVVAKGYVYPPVLFVLGLSLWWWMNHFHAISIPLVLGITIAIALLWIAIIPFIAKAYQKAVERSIEKGFFSGVSLFLQNDKVEKLLLEKVTFGKEEERIHALHLLNKSDYAGLEKLVLALLPSAAPNTRLQLIGIIADKNYKSAIPLLHQLQQSAQTEQQETVVFATLCKIDGDFLQQTIQRFATLPAQQKRAILEAFPQQHHLLPQHFFDEILSAALEQQDAAENLMAVLEFGPKEWQEKVFQSLFNKALPTQVHAKLLRMAGKMEKTEYLPRILDALPMLTLSSAAKDALIAMGDKAFHDPLLADQAAVTKTGTTEQLIDAASHVHTHASRKFLLWLLAMKGPWHEKVINALWMQGLTPSPEEKEIFIREALHLLQQATDKKSLLAVHSPAGGLQLQLARAIQNEVRSNTYAALKLIAVSHGHDYVQRIIDLVENKQTEKLHNAIELLDITLPKTYFRQLQELMDFMTLSSNVSLQRSQVAPAPSNNKLLSLVLERQEMFSSWTRSLAWYHAATNHEHQLLLHQYPPQNKPLVTPIEAETQQFVLSYISR